MNLLKDGLILPNKFINYLKNCLMNETAGMNDILLAKNAKKFKERKTWKQVKQSSHGSM